MPAGGDPRTSATEIYRDAPNGAPVKAQRKRVSWGEEIPHIVRPLPLAATGEFMCENRRRKGEKVG